MIKSLSVIIPTYNPDEKRLGQTLDGLRKQTLPAGKWELLIINNNSSIPVAPDLSWHPAAIIINESRQGLTYARLKGFNTARGELIILVDDDNILNESYLQNAWDIFETNQTLGVAGGKSLPLYEAEQPYWVKHFHINLALRDAGEQIIKSRWANKFPDFAPVGAGLCLRKEALAAYIYKIENNESSISDRKGNSLSSGGDNDIVLEIIKSGWEVGYFPNLSLQHIIPAQRMEADYLARLMNNTNKSWIELLQSHGINPWRKIPAWTTPLRKLKAWFTYKAWQNKVNYINWRGACGTFDGLSAINNDASK